MKNKTKACLLTMTLIFLFMAFICRVYADNPTSFDLISDKTGIETGEQFSVTVESQNVRDLDAYEVNLSFDVQKLDFIKAKSNIEGFTVPARINGNQIIMANAKMGDAATENGDLTICTFTFKGKQKGEAYITLNSIKLMDGVLAESNYIVNKMVSVRVSEPEPIVLVSSIEVIGANGVTTITTKDGKLQMIATVSPANATNKNVTWSVENGTGSATISDTGLLTAVSNGTVTVKATAQDSSGEYGTCTIKISYEISDDGTDTDDEEPDKDDDREHEKGGDKEPVKEGIIKIQVTTDTEGTKEEDIYLSDIQAAIDSSGGHTVRMQIRGAKGAKSIKVNIPAREIIAAVDKHIEKIEIETEIATVLISTDVLKNSVGELSSDVQLSISKVDKSTLSEELKQIVGDNEVYDFSLSVDGNKISHFDGSDDVRVAINYTLKPGEDPDKVIVYYIDDSGKLEVVTNGRYNPATGKVEFSPKHFSKYAAVYNDVTFNDIAGVPWAKQSIEALAARTVINGYGDGAFKPDGIVTRAEFIKILIQAFDLADESAECSLMDVEEGAWYYSSIASAQKLGIVKGKEDGNFGVNDEITRQDMAVMIYRAAQLLKAGLSSGASTVQFTDESEISAYAADAVTAMQRAGIINGVGDGSFAPKSQATRAQAAVIIYRLFSLVK